MRLPLSDPDLLREHAFIAGRWCDADDGTRCEVRNPASGALLGHVPDMGATENDMVEEAPLIRASNHQHPDHDTREWPPHP